MENTIPQSDSERDALKDTSKSVRVTTSVWESVSHEAIYRRSSIAALLGVAWARFIELPEAKRERIVRDLEGDRERVA